MERPVTLRPLSIQDENSAIHRQKATVDGKSKISKSVSNNGGAGLGSRKALNDITNKSFIHLEASSQKKSSQSKKHDVVEDGNMHHHVFEAEALSKKKSSISELLNVAEERFLHDHSKCIDAQKAAMELNFWDTVLPGHDTVELAAKQSESDPDISSLRCYPEPEKLSISEFSDWFESGWKSPPSSPTCWDSPPLSPFAWDIEPIELTLKEEDDCRV